MHNNRMVNTEYTVEMKEKKKKGQDKKKLTEAEFLQEWEDDETSIDTIFLPRSRGPLGRNRNIDLKRVNITINGNELLAGATLRLHEGRHYGLVGRNGVGKSTLLRRMALGKIALFPDYLMVLHVKQEVDGSETSVLDTVIQSDKERLSLLDVIVTWMIKNRNIRDWRKRWTRWTSLRMPVIVWTKLFIVYKKSMNV